MIFHTDQAHLRRDNVLPASVKSPAEVGAGWRAGRLGHRSHLGMLWAGPPRVHSSRRWGGVAVGALM